MNKTYQATKSEWPIETGYVDRLQRSATGPLLTAEGDGSPMDAPQMLIPGIYAIPPIGAKVQFQHNEKEVYAGLMVEWPEEALAKLAARSAMLPEYNPGDVLIVAAGALLSSGILQYIHFKADGSVTWNTLDAVGTPITELTSDDQGLIIKTKKFSVTAETLSIIEAG